MRLLTIKKRPDFVLNSKQGMAFHAKTVMVLASKTPQKYLADPITNQVTDFCRVGYTASKKVGGAVIRNKIKRRLREVVRVLYVEFCINHYDYVIIAKREAAGADSKTLQSDVKFCLRILAKKITSSN